MIAGLTSRFAARTAAGPATNPPAPITQTCQGSSTAGLLDGAVGPVYSQAMPDRLAGIESRLTSLEARLEEHHRDMVERIDGGPSVQWERSVRGRLHTLEAESLAAKAAALALSEAQRERRKAHDERNNDVRGLWRLRLQAAAIGIAVLALAGPYLHHL